VCDAADSFDAKHEQSAREAKQLLRTIGGRTRSELHPDDRKRIDSSLSGLRCNRFTVQPLRLKATTSSMQQAARESYRPSYALAGHSSLGGPWRPDDDEDVSEGLGQSCLEEAEDVPDFDRYRREMDRLEQRLAAHHQTDDETMRMSADDLDAAEARMVELKSRSVAAGVKDEVCGACGVILTSRSYCPTCGSTPGGTRWCLGTSIWAPRRKWCDGRDFYDHDNIMFERFSHDWKVLECTIAPCGTCGLPPLTTSRHHRI